MGGINKFFDSLPKSDWGPELDSLVDAISMLQKAYLAKGGCANVAAESPFSICRTLALRHPYRPAKLIAMRVNVLSKSPFPNTIQPFTAESPYYHLTIPSLNVIRAPRLVISCYIYTRMFPPHWECIPIDRRAVQMLRPHTKALGRSVDVVWSHLNVTFAMGQLRPYTH